jgi:hypothetical protein
VRSLEVLLVTARKEEGVSGVLLGETLAIGGKDDSCGIGLRAVESVRVVGVVDDGWGLSGIGGAGVDASCRGVKVTGVEGSVQIGR